jgi:UDP-glucose 4-epimerase
MKVLVLGGSGFLGSYVVDDLRAAGHEIISLDRYQERFRSQPQNVEHYQADFGNRGALESVLSSGVDVVVHLVSSTIPQSSNEDPIFDVQSNLIESIALLEMCVKHQVRKVVFASSGGTVYGLPKSDLITEAHITQPLCSYGVSKLAIEHYLHLFYVLHGLKYHVLRLSNPFGPRQDPRSRQGAVGVFMHLILKELPIKVWGDGSVVRDYVHARDFAKACLAAVVVDKVGTVNIGSGVGISIKNLIAAVEQAADKKAVIEWLPGRNFDVPRVVLDCSLAKQQLDWSPSINMQQGLLETKQWMSQLIDDGKL